MKAKDVPKNTILEVDFARNYEEYLPRAHLGRLLVKEGLVLRSVVESMLKVSEDERVRMLVAVIGGSGMGWRKIQEIRDAVIAFGKNGKSAIVFAETLGEFGPGNKSYQLARPFDEIYLQPSGDVGLTGLRMRTPFLQQFL